MERRETVSRRLHPREVWFFHLQGKELSDVQRTASFRLASVDLR